MMIRSPEPEVKIVVDRDPVKTSFEEWARPGHFSRTIAKGPDTTTWIWNLHADAHDFDSHTGDLEEISRKVFSAHFGQLSIIFLWLSGMYFHGARFSNYEAWQVMELRELTTTCVISRNHDVVTSTPLNPSRRDSALLADLILHRREIKTCCSLPQGSSLLLLQHVLNFCGPLLSTQDIYSCLFVSIDKPTIALRKCVCHNSCNRQFPNASQYIIETLDRKSVV